MLQDWQTIHEGDDLEAYHRLSDGNSTLAVTFDYMSQVSRPPNVHAASFFRRAHCDQIHIVCKEDIWYQSEELLAVCRIIAEKRKGYSRVVSYGNSMGAYGAILTSKLIGADMVIAFAPQFSVDSAVVPSETRWSPITTKIHFIFNDLTSYVSPHTHYYIIYDPLCREDAHHAKLLSSLRPMTDIKIHNAGHFPAMLLQEIGILDTFMSALLNGTYDRNQFRQMVRRGRRQSPSYYTRLAGMLSSKNRTLAAINAANIAYTMDPESSVVLNTYFGILSFSPHLHVFADMAVRLLLLKHPDAEYYKMFRRQSLARLKERYGRDVDPPHNG